MRKREEKKDEKKGRIELQNLMQNEKKIEKKLKKNFKVYLSMLYSGSSPLPELKLPPKKNALAFGISLIHTSKYTRWSTF